MRSKSLVSMACFSCATSADDSTNTFSFGQLGNPYDRAILNCASAIEFAACVLSRSFACFLRWRRFGRTGSEREGVSEPLDNATSFHRRPAVRTVGLKEGLQRE